MTQHGKKDLLDVARIHLWRSRDGGPGLRGEHQVLARLVAPQLRSRG